MTSSSPPSSVIVLRIAAQPLASSVQSVYASVRDGREELLLLDEDVLRLFPQKAAAGRRRARTAEARDSGIALRGER